jgi:hypothetical protein
MIVGISQRVSNGLYRARGVQAHQPIPSGDRDRDVIRWAQHSLFLLERFIRERPHEWFMPEQLWLSQHTEPEVGTKLFTTPSPKIINTNEILIKNCDDPKPRKLT